MPAPPPHDLAALRAELDGIDDAIHDALMRRADVVAAIAASRAKSGVPLRPGREAAILRRLLARHTGPLAPVAVTRIWRELFAATTALQGPLAIGVYEPGDGGVLALAREHFGALTATRPHATFDGTLADVRAGVVTAAVVPRDSQGYDPPAGWWNALARQGSSRLCIVARLPFWAARPEGASRAEAFVIAATTPDPSSDDVGILSLELPREVDPGHYLARAVTEAGFKLLRGDFDHDLPGAMVEVSGLVADADPRLLHLARHTGGSVTVLGGYARPFEAA